MVKANTIKSIGFLMVLLIKNDQTIKRLLNTLNTKMLIRIIPTILSLKHATMGSLVSNSNTDDILLNELDINFEMRHSFYKYLSKDALLE